MFLSIKRPSTFINSNLKSSDDYIFNSLILSQNNNQERSKLILREGLKLYQKKDTLTKLYELFSFISENKVKKSKVIVDENRVVNKTFTTKGL